MIHLLDSVELRRPPPLTRRDAVRGKPFRNVRRKTDCWANPRSSRQLSTRGWFRRPSRVICGSPRLPTSATGFWEFRGQRGVKRFGHVNGRKRRKNASSGPKTMLKQASSVCYLPSNRFIQVSQYFMFPIQLSRSQKSRQCCKQTNLKILNLLIEYQELGSTRSTLRVPTPTDHLGLPSQHPPTTLRQRHHHRRYIYCIEWIE